ncbi:ISBma1, transposase [Burkholderia sp. TJI49]|nr:ISBma1, transposase [Burkholderia sp. TJI49]
MDGFPKARPSVSKPKPDQAVHLEKPLAANQSPVCVYVLRDELKLLGFYREPA